jgi:hypothetical protein
MSSQAGFPDQCGKLGERGLNKNQVSVSLIAAEIPAITEIAAIGVSV